MKNKYRKLAVIMLTAVCFAGCQQEDIVYRDIFWNSIIHRIFDKD